MSLYNDKLESELGSLCDHFAERADTDGDAPPSLVIAEGKSRRMRLRGCRRERVLWRLDDPSGRFTIYALYQAWPATKRRKVATIELERVRMIMPGRFNASYAFDDWLNAHYDSLKVHGFAQRLELGRFLLKLGGNGAADRQEMIDGLNLDELTGDADAPLIKMAL